MKVSDLRTKSKDELRQELDSLRREQFNLNVQRGVGSSPKNHLFKQVRISIARVLTLLKERD